jgi:hypothetical protein
MPCSAVVKGEDGGSMGSETLVSYHNIPAVKASKLAQIEGV